MATTRDPTSGTSGRPASSAVAPSLGEDARRVAEALAHILLVLKFRDRDRVSPYGLTASQWYALRVVAGGDGLAVNHLAGAMYVDKSTASRIAGALVDRELVARQGAEDDGRAVRLVVTPTGRALAAAIQADEERDTATLLANLDPVGRAQLRQAVLRLEESAAASVDTAGGGCWVVR